MALERNEVHKPYVEYNDSQLTLTGALSTGKAFFLKKKKIRVLKQLEIKFFFSESTV